MMVKLLLIYIYRNEEFDGHIPATPVRKILGAEEQPRYTTMNSIINGYGLTD